MESVYVLHHIREDDEYGDDAKLIGVYRSLDSANAAIRRLSTQPGFRDYVEGFDISEFPLDKDHWEEGFVRLINVMMPLYGEGMDVWRPVQAELFRDGRYQIIGPMPSDEQWRFPPDTIVHCEVQQRPEGEALVAVSRA